MMNGDRSETIQTPIEDQIMERLKERIYRKSHSLNSVRLFDNSIKHFERYMREKELSIPDIAKSPLQSLDDFSGWLDENGYSPRTVIGDVFAAKRLLKAHGVKITLEDFKEVVVLPKKRPFEDKKVDAKQIRRIVLACNSSGLKLQLMVMKDTMARPIEVTGLQLKHFHLDKLELPYLKIPSELSKNDIPRELFFTLETKEILKSYLTEKSITEQDDYIFLLGYKFTDEKDFQAKLAQKCKNLITAFRKILERKCFADINKKVDGKHKLNRYEIRPYSFKKFAYTVVSDVLGESAAKSMKGDSDYEQTYYKKTLLERMEGYKKVISKLSVFGASEDVRLETRQQLVNEISDMSADAQQRLLKSLIDSKNLSKG
ncbi:MAG: hypothetical protein EX285_06610 [Thaumarchaeota archaeon]|nr:hypothetical protein [Nitrososphaerota archaeon]